MTIGAASIPEMPAVVGITMPTNGGSCGTSDAHPDPVNRVVA
jgi:hypothetical protein